MLYRDLFKEQVMATPDATALVFQEEETTWRELDSLSNRFAQGLLKLGIQKGDRVAAILPNCRELIVTYLALLKQGGVFVPLNFQLTASHITYAVNHSESTVLICDDAIAPVIEKIRPELTTVKHVITIGPREFGEGMLAFEDVLSMGTDNEPSTPMEEDDTAIFLYTAGTTGEPKAVVHTHFNCCFVARHWAGAFGMETGKSVLQVLPLFHAFALHCVTLPALISGTRIVMTDKYSTQWVLEAIEKYHIEILALVPAMGSMIVNHDDFSGYDLSGPEIALLGGAIVPFDLLKEWRKGFPKLKIINGYGQTESCPCCTGLWDVDILEKPRSIGKPWDVTELKILDNNEAALGPHEVGEIVYKVPSIMKAYYKDPELTAQTVKDGWLYSGDLGYVDEDGYVYIVDRKKDIIIRGGENISSMEVEEVLHEHPDIVEAGAIGAPDMVLGETVMAVAVRKSGSGLTAEALIDFAARRLEHFKVPTRVEFVEALPRNPGGKVLKRELKAKYFGNNP
ncbi:MAG: acyl--CoA ligase [Deltaproteobacteria bacterium]|nr:acyl--CoA ligase [Deltaproteobacteria bacterium]MBW1818501.1 acyl--CoA ligase [Deltaproteobacteria bacterium]